VSLHGPKPLPFGAEQTTHTVKKHDLVYTRTRTHAHDLVWPGSLVQSSPVSKHSQRGTLNGLVETQTPHEPTILTTVLASRKQSRLFRIVHSSSQACNSIKKTREFELNISYHIFKPFCLYYTYIAVFGIFIVKLITGNSRFIIYHKVKG
jgi:hypothetical protein